MNVVPIGRRKFYIHYFIYYNSVFLIWLYHTYIFFKGKDAMLSVTLCRALLLISFIYFSIVVDSEEVCNECDIFFIVIKLCILKNMFSVNVLNIFIEPDVFYHFLFMLRTITGCCIGYFWNYRKNICERKSV